MDPFSPSPGPAPATTLAASLVVGLVSLVTLCACAPPTTIAPVAPVLPMERSFPARTQLELRLGNDEAPATRISGTGQWTLRFEASDTPDVARVRLVDADIGLEPFWVQHDLDGDGRRSVEKVESLRLESGDFDLERSTGELNLRSGEFRMTIAHRLTPARIPALEALGSGPVEFEFSERGQLDLESGQFLTHTEPVALPAPFQSVVLGNCETSSSCRPTIAGFGVTPGFVCRPGCTPGLAPNLGLTVYYSDGKQACNPADSDAGFSPSKKFSVSNDTKQLPITVPSWTVSANKAYYAALLPMCVESQPSACPAPLSVRSDTWLQLTAYDSCGEQADVEREQLRFLPANPASGYHFRLCTQEGDEASLGGLWQFPARKEYGPSPGGFGIVLASVENPAGNSYAVLVGTGNVPPGPQTIDVGNALAAPYAGRAANQPWVMHIAAAHRSQFDDDVRLGRFKDFCVNVRLRCNCGTS